MKRLIKTVDLRFFRDDANGEWGLAHADTLDSNYGNGFNAFWSGMGFFHDVFEHSHEHQNKYFRGEYAMNIGGEMAAMGSMMYYIDTLEVYNRLNDNARWRGHGEIMRESTLSDVKDAMYSGYYQYGNEVLSNVPKQSPVENGELEYQLREYYKQAKAAKIECTEENEIEFAKNYKRSITFRKIADLHRYGYRMAEKLVPNNWDNRTMLVDFMKVWNDFTKNNKAEDLANNFQGITFKLYKENDRITWVAILESNDYTAKDIKLTAENIKYYDQESIMLESYAHEFEEN